MTRVQIKTASVIFGSIVALVAGCALPPMNNQRCLLYFGHDPLNHGMQEAIEEIEIRAASARLRDQTKLPTDWIPSTIKTNGNPVGLLLTCNRPQFAVSDIHAFDGLVELRADRENSAVEVNLTVTRGYFGPGRVVVLGRKDLLLK